MHLKDYISRDLVFTIHNAVDKAAFLKDLVGRVKERFEDIDDDTLLTRLIEREEGASTGIGHGVAIPHATVEGLKKTLCIVAQTRQGLDFKSLDSSPVHIIFLLLSPPQATGTHVRLLARIARLVSEDRFILKIANAKDEDELYTLIHEEDNRHV
jgi:PTS system nitrogen regulatory IIA component